MELQGKTVLITGGSRGIGKAIALALSGEKMNVAINFLNHQKEAEQVCEQIKEQGGQAQYIQADVSKAGLIGLSHSYASLLVKEGITSNAISPALIETDMLLKDLKLDSPAKIPMGRFGTPEEVAEVAVMLAKNAYITGQTINVNGGWYFS